ncbi:MAG: hypothetical protein JXQ65_04555 [Candidatus Marinimicrobia bacterium]|nr:hypothetical protein [Candidatus Neomarinimicrobiota bacterium]
MKIGIRREDKNQWEGRVPLIPADIKELKEQYNLEFVIQPSTIRAFRDEEFEAAGAIVREDLSDCKMIIAVKEIPVDFFDNHKRYLFFSHTIKGQKENMKILSAILKKQATLMDYERIVDDHNRRIVFFGKYAGIAGMIDSFYGFGKKLKLDGIESPFDRVKYALDYQDVATAKEELEIVGRDIQAGKMPVPVIIGIAGYGNVSKGAQEIIDTLPCREMTPEVLLSIDKNTLDKTHIYKVVFKEIDMVVPKEAGHLFSLEEYYHYPDQYESIFSPCLFKLDIFINATYWEPRYPRLVTCGFLRKHAPQLKDLRVIGDISCDVGGSVECNRKVTGSGDPFYVYEPAEDKIRMGLEGNGPAVLAVDNLPCEISRDSSVFFSHILKKYVPELSNGSLDSDLEHSPVSEELKRSIIIHKGKFTPGYKYLKTYLEY